MSVLNIHGTVVVLLSCVLVMAVCEVKSSKAPAYFFSHGGPTFMYPAENDGDEGAYNTVHDVGQEVVEFVKPKGIVVFSAHWLGTPDGVLVNTAVHTDLIYDFSNYPEYMYKEKYPNVGSEELSGEVLNLLGKHGIKAKGVCRGLDHGVWVPFSIAFPPKTYPLNVPIVQVSLFDNDDPNKHYELGKALAPLRKKGIVIIGSGMSVHNLDERYDYPDRTPTEYSLAFDEAFRVATTTHVGELRKKDLEELTKRPDARHAHPTFEHLLPIHIAAGAAHEETGVKLYSNQEAYLAWGQYRFGVVPNE